MPPEDTIAESSQSVGNPSYILPRTVGGWGVNDVIDWILGKKALSYKGENDNRRVLSVIGPPGSGKTTYLRGLKERIDKDLIDPEKNNNIIALYLDLSLTVKEQKDRTSTQHNRKLCRELLNKLNELSKPPVSKNFKNVKLSGRDEDNTNETLTTAIRSLCSQKCVVVLLIDQVDDLPDDDEWQYDIERNVIVPIYSASSDCTRVILARREEQRVREAGLKWENVPMLLQPLTDDQPIEQIHLRLEALAAADLSGFTQLAEDLEYGLLGLSETKIREIINIVNSGQDESLVPPAERLTGNPLVNLQLLYRSFLNDAERPMSIIELNQVLEAYWQRAGLADDEHAKLRQVLLIMIRGWGADEPNWNPAYWSQVDYAKLYNNGRVPFSIDELAPAFKAGVVMMMEVTRRYQFDPALISLANGSQNAPQQGGG